MRRREQALGSGAELFYDNPLELVRGEGAYLFDRSGRRYVDLYNNVPCVGHGNPAVVRAMAEQQAELNVHSRYLHEGIVTFAERLVGLHHDGVESAVFSCSGTEAVEVALQIARLETGQRGIICSDATYHGNSELVDSLSYLWEAPPKTGEIRAFPFPDLYRPIEDGLFDETLCQAYLDRVSAEIASLKAEGQGLAALIVCSIFANEGTPDVPQGFMARLTELVHAEGGLVIADEVQSGYGRTGVWWGYQKMGFTPDIAVMGKPMGNGLPLAATVASRRLIDAFRTKRDYFNTCAASPLQAAVGMAVIDEIERLGLLQNAAEIGRMLAKELTGRIDTYEQLGDVRGSGLFLNVEMVTDKVSRQPDPDFAHQICEALKDHGFLAGTNGKYGNALKIRPPLVFSRENAAEFLVAFDTCLESFNAC